MLKKYSKYVLSMSFGNLHSGAGGVDKYIMTQKKIANKKNIGYIYIFYVKKIIKNKMIFFRFGLIIDGKYLGVYTTNQIIYILKNNSFNIESVYINHLWFAKISEIDKILSRVSYKNIYFILHDYYTCCTNFTLYEKGKYCNSSKIGCSICKDCQNYNCSLKSENKIWNLLNKYIDNITFVSPSNCTKKIFLKFHNNFKSEKVIIVPNQEILFDADDSKVNLNSKLRIAFLGNDNQAKGWNEFKVLVERFKSSYDFYTFNCYNKVIDGAKLINAKYDSNHINGMVDFLKEENIDVVILWAKWPETFSYVATESLASKCYMITYKDSGNIVDIINNNESGKVYNSFDELLDDMSNDIEFTNIVNEYRQSKNYTNIKIVDNQNIILEKPEELIKNRSLKLPHNKLRILNKILNKYLIKKFKMEDI